MKIRITYIALYLASIFGYITLSAESVVRWPNVFVSVAGVIACFFFVGQFIQSKAKPKAICIFRGILFVVQILYGIMIILNILKGWYANALFGIVFIAPMSALLIELYLPKTKKSQPVV